MTITQAFLDGMAGIAAPTIFSPRIIEAINGSAFVVHLAMAFYFGRYVLLRFKDYGVSWETYLRVDGSLSVTILSIGMAIVRGAFWALRFLQNHNIGTDGLGPYLTFGAIVGAIITIVGGLCAIRVFSPPGEGRWPWLLTGLLAVAAGGVAFL